MVDLNIEFKGEAYNLKRGGVYILKVHAPQITREIYESMTQRFKDLGVDVVILLCEDMDQVQLMETGKN